MNKIEGNTHIGDSLSTATHRVVKQDTLDAKVDRSHYPVPRKVNGYNEFVF